MINPVERLDGINAEISLLERQMQQIRDNTSIDAVKQQQAINQLVIKQRDLTKDRLRAIRDIALEGRVNAFRLLKATVAKIPVAITMEDLPKLTELSNEINAHTDTNLIEDINASREAINDLKAEIAAKQEQILNEEKHCRQVLADAYASNPLYVELNFPQFAAELTGDIPSTPIATTSTAAAGEARKGQPKSGDNPDHDAMRVLITPEAVKEAIANGADPKTNVEIIKWIARNKLGREVAIDQTLRTKVYNIRDGLGYV